MRTEEREERTSNLTLIIRQKVEQLTNIMADFSDQHRVFKEEYLLSSRDNAESFNLISSLKFRVQEFEDKQ
ncbi:unnamed protein product [Sphagnum balticum]